MALPLISVALKFCIVCAFNGVLLMVLSVESCDSFFLRAAVPSRSGLTQLQSMLYTGKGPSRPPQPPNPDDGQKDDKDTVADTPDILKIDLTRDVEQISEEDCVPQEDVFGGSAGPLPSVSSKINMKEEKLKEGLAELWIVGAGTMGSILAKKMAAQITASGKAGENMMVIAETASNKRHKEFLDIEGEVVLPKIRSEREEDDERMARNVIVCLPPSAATGRQGSYINELSEAFRLWAGPKGGGQLVLISSTAVYGDSFGNTVTEKFRLDTRSARSTRMIAAEEAILKRGGTVLRLAGLYGDIRGPHSYWLRDKTKKAKEGGEEDEADPNMVSGAADGLLNMLHYDDAAACALAVINKGKRGEVYLACDGKPISRREICEAALSSGQFSPPEYMSSTPPFQSEIGGAEMSKLCNCDWTRRALSWQPRYSDFGSYMRRMGKGERLEDFDCSDAERGGLPEEKEKEAPGLWLPGDDDDMF